MSVTVTKFNRGSEKKPAVPKRDEKPIHGLVSDKNFIVANAVENILAGKSSPILQCKPMILSPGSERHLDDASYSWVADLNLRKGVMALHPSFANSKLEVLAPLN